MAATKPKGNGSSWEENGPVEVQIRCCPPSAMSGQGRASPGSASQSPPAPSCPRGWVCSVTPGPCHCSLPACHCQPFGIFSWGRFPLSWCTLPRQTSGQGGSPCATMPALPRGAALLGDPCHLPTMAPRVHLTKKRGRKGAGRWGVGWKCLALPLGCCWGWPCLRLLSAHARSLPALGSALC